MWWRLPCMHISHFEEICETSSLEAVGVVQKIQRQIYAKCSLQDFLICMSGKLFVKHSVALKYEEFGSYLLRPNVPLCIY